MVHSVINQPNINQQTPVATPTPTPEVSRLDSELQAAREHARRLTAMYGTGLPEVAVAWDVVEELLAEKARQRQARPTAFSNYCEQNPDAPECRVYEV